MANIRNIASTKLPRKDSKYSIIIPGAGMGTRMVAYGAKPLIQLSPRRTIIERQLGIIDKVFSKYEVILVTGHESERVMNNTPSHLIKVINPYYENTNVVKSIGIGLRAATTERVVIIYGDLVFNKETLQCPFDLDSMLVISNFMKKTEVGCILNGNYVEEMFFNYENKWAQILYLTNKELKLFQELSWNPQYERAYGFEIINKVIQHNGKIKTFKPKKSKIIDVDTVKDLKLAKTIL